MWLDKQQEYGYKTAVGDTNIWFDLIYGMNEP